ncbi:hypothetical protein [Micavibrio aeruginosavorus]|uniref:hypothetical protein n=1 Tax=Micavibrio aeruginosavorus TaxID=349221 RepID=UPI003F4AB53A
MIRFLIMIVSVLAFVAVATPAQAQSRTQSQTQAKEQAKEQEELPPQTRTPITTDRANHYYAQCMAADDQRMSDDAQAELCSCTSVKMMSRFSMEELDIIGKPTKLGKELMYRMQTQVYGPCMQTAAQDLLFNECMRDKKIMDFDLRDMPKLCRCMSKRSAAYLETDGEAMMRSILANNPDLRDPLPAIMSSPSFRQQASNNLFSCLREGNSK